ncbi:PTS lactose/cellobiose transporter subunit IIA [Paenibacillus macerans]|uniref:PTS lactose/cellobiose transporter subunit IIA n=1 Tax=Paenibacillus macerans TaxID=44252 RepID=UPI002041891A|nr:PTS lactose/cellobiose transporter subunit IIA [Paenibacillus macerans]MCM3699533.1 PTS lactose/cellobiose transporter subunit IIA [Paenibacillus macerans]
METNHEINLEQICMEMISSSGAARGLLLEAMDYVKPKNEEKIRELFEEANSLLRQAHRSQTSLMTGESNGQKVEMSVLVVHAQDHLMTTLTIRDLVEKLTEVL